MANSTQHQQQSQQQNSQQQQPTQQHQVPSKRDKRRNLLSDRLTDLSVSFDKDRDVHYRSQLAALQQDFNAIARADTSGRDMKMLDDGAEGIDKFVTGGVFLGGNASGADGAVPNARGAGPGVVGGVQPGTFYAGFVAEVNERMEERDVGLTMLHVQYHAKLASLKSSHERNIHHAREEHIHLAVTMKQRLINRLYNAKKKLSLDKEHLDISDTSAMLLHPNQFTIGAGPGGVLGSPGRDLNDRSGNLGDIFGSGGNGANGSTGGRRKLRQRRNELEDLMMMGPGGIFDNFGTSRDRDHAGNSESAAKIGAAQLASMLQKQQSSSGGSQSQAVYNSHTSNGIGAGTTSNAQELLVKPVWSIDKLFTEKELQMAGNLAALATVKYFTVRPDEGAEDLDNIRKGVEIPIPEVEI
ncbi:Sds3-like-domain-containing protein, partial [Peziza echinospora]